MRELRVHSIQLTRATMLRRAANGKYSAIENVDVAGMLASVRAISLHNNRFPHAGWTRVLHEFACSRMCFSFPCRACVAVCRSTRRCSSNVVRRTIGNDSCLFDSTALQVSYNDQLLSLPSLTMFRFLEYLDVRLRAVRHEGTPWGNDLVLARKVAYCRLLTSLVGLERVTTLHTLIVGLRVRTHMRKRY